MLDHLVKKCIVSFNLIVTKRKFSYIQNNRVIVMIGVQYRKLIQYERETCFVHIMNHKYIFPWLGILQAITKQKNCPYNIVALNKLKSPPKGVKLYKKLVIPALSLSSAGVTGILDKKTFVFCKIYLRNNYTKRRHCP